MRKPDLLVLDRYPDEDMGELEPHCVLHVLSESTWPDALIDPGFTELDNMVLQPHRSNAAVETRTAMAGLISDNLHAFFNSRPLLTEYTR